MGNIPVLYANEAIIYSQKNEICLTHQATIPTLVTEENINEIRTATSDPNINVGMYIGKRQDVVSVYMTLENAHKLFGALDTALKNAEKNKDGVGVA